MLKFFYFVCGLMTPIIDAGFVDFTKNKPIMCFYTGSNDFFPNAGVPILDPNCVPLQCEIIVFFNFFISTTSQINCSTDILKILVSSNIPVLLEVHRYPDKYEWSDILACDGNPADAKAVTDFALENGVKGILLFGIFEKKVDSAMSAALVNSTVHYINNLKTNNDLVVGVVLNPYPNTLKIYDYELLNDVVDFYDMNTIDRNFCDGSVLHGTTPIHGSGDIVGLDTVIGYLNATKLAIPKMYFVANLNINDDQSTDTSYDKVCTGAADRKTWCIASTKDNYETAKFLHDQNFGMIAMWVNLDDTNNACGCGAFIMLTNLVAGYKGEAQVPCAPIDC